MSGFVIPVGRIISLHGRPVRQIELNDGVVRLWSGEGQLYLMVEADGRMWLWDGDVDP